MAARRSYTVRVVADAPPEQRAPNTVYLGRDGVPSNQGTILYRVYLPDRGRDDPGIPADQRTGGTGLPEVSIRTSDGSELSQEASCEFFRQASAPPVVNQTYAGVDGPDGNPSSGSSDPIRWEAFFNVFYSLSGGAESTPAAELRQLVPRDRSGGFFSNVDNAYVSARTHRGFEPVLVVEGLAPSAPRTLDGQLTMGVRAASLLVAVRERPSEPALHRLPLRRGGDHQPAGRVRSRRAAGASRS